MSTLFAALSALAYGAADFAGGRATRAHHVMGVLVLSQSVGLVGIVIVALVLRHPWPAGIDLAWGAAAGISGVVGLGLLYRGLAAGSAAIVSPTAALAGTAAPIVVGVLLGETPQPTGWAGIALALPAILLLSLTRDDERSFDGVSLAMGVAAGLGFGGYYILIDQTAGTSGFWPLVSARLASVVAVSLLATVARQSLAVVRRARGPAVFAGVLDMAANVFFLIAARSGLLVTAAVVSSLYPAPTVLLARIVDREVLGPRRIIGLLLALGGVALMAV